MMRAGARGLMMAVLTLGLTACPEEDVKYGRLTMRITDSPGDFDELWIDIQGVEVNTKGGNPTEGWVALPDVTVGRYNLIELAAGRDSTFLDIEHPMSYYEQFRLLIGNDNAVVIDGTEYPLPLASSDFSKIRFKNPISIVEGFNFIVLLDVDAAESVRETAPGEFVFEPTISMLFVDTQGSVEGTINPADERVAVYAVANSDTVKTTFSDATTGKFLLRGLAAGRYNIILEPGENSSYLPKTINQVVVLLQETSQLGTQDLPQ
jgi:hypothetical protein